MRLRREFLKNFAIRIDHAADELRFRARPHGRKRGIARSHVDRCHFVGAQRHRRRWLDVRP